MLNRYPSPLCFLYVQSREGLPQHYQGMFFSRHITFIYEELTIIVLVENERVGFDTSSYSNNSRNRSMVSCF